MAGRKRKKSRKSSKRTFNVTSAEKAELLTAVAEANRDGSLPFDEAMVEVRKKTDEIAAVLTRDGAPPITGK